jgi:hypothetical protein
LLRKQMAPAFIACASTASSGKAVKKMIGMRRPRATVVTAGLTSP